MSFCGTIVRQVTWLERQTQILATKVCRVEALENCADWKDEGYKQCTRTRDDGYNTCSKTRDDGYNSCCDWAPCSWFCDALVWISSIVCVAWTWISSIVCIVWNWVSKWICRALYWVYRTICKLIMSIIFWFVRRVVLWLILLPCQFHRPKLDNRVRHIFVLVLENRSFDHMLGATPIRGRDAEDHDWTETLRRPEGTTNDVVDADGKVTRCVVGTGQKRSVGVDPGHEFGDTLVGLCGADAAAAYPPYPAVNNSGFAQNFSAKEHETPCSVMLSYRGHDEQNGEADVPVLTALAEEFAVCDHWFSSLPGPTWPNRLFIHAASSAGLDDSPSTGDSLLDALVAGISFDNGNIYDLVSSENIDWAVYHGDEFPQVLALSGMDVTTTLTHFHDMDDFEADLADGSMANYVFIEPNYGDDVTGSTYKCGNSQHPLDDITHGERLIKRVYESIRNSPLWNSSMLIVTYDEGGGFFDHVPPGPTVPPGDSTTDPANNHNNFDFTQLGVRVPAIVCSPWIPRNVIDHRGYEHASIAGTVERLWGLPSMTDRDAHARDLTSLLSLSSPRGDAPLSLPIPAEPESHCPDNPPARGQTASGLTVTRPARATILDPVTRTRAQQENPTAITSTAAAFFMVAVRRDLLLAPPHERGAIFTQARRFQTMGEVGVYTQKVVTEIQRHQPPPAPPTGVPARPSYDANYESGSTSEETPQ